MSFGFSPYLSAAQLSSIGSSLAPGAYPTYTAHPPLAVTGGVFGIYNDSGDRITIVTDDATLTGDASTTIPTEHAVKTYVDARVISVPLLLSGAVPYQLFLENGVERVSLGCDGAGLFNIDGTMILFNTNMPLSINAAGTQLTMDNGTDSSTMATSTVDNRLAIATSLDEMRLTSGTHVRIPMTTASTSIGSGALQCSGGASFDGDIYTGGLTIDNAVNPVLTLKKGATTIPIGLNASNEIYFQDRLLIEDADPQLILKNTSGDLGNLRVVTDGSSRFLTVNPALGIYNGTDSIRFQIDGSSVVQVSQIGISHFNWRGVPHVFENYVRTPELRLKNTAVGTAAIIEQNASGEVESDSTLYVNTGDPVIKLRDASTGEEAEMHVGGASTSLGVSCVMAQSGLGIQSSGAGPKTFFQFNGDVMEVSHRTGVTDWIWRGVPHEFVYQPTHGGNDLVSTDVTSSTYTTSGAYSGSMGIRFDLRNDLVFATISRFDFTATSTDELRVTVPASFRPSATTKMIYTVNAYTFSSCSLATGGSWTFYNQTGTFTSGSIYWFDEQTLVWHV